MAVNFVKIKKSALCTFYMYLVFLFCYLPWHCAFVVRSFIHEANTTFWNFHQYTKTLVYLNSSLNRSVYSWGMRHNGQSIMCILRRAWCFFLWTALVLSLTYVIGQSSSLRENYAQLRRNVDFNYKNLNLVSLSMFHPPTRGSRTYFLLSTNDSGQRLIYLVICLLADGFQWTLHYT